MACADVVITPEVRHRLHRPQGGNVREAGLHVRWRDSEERRRRRSCEARAQDGFALSVGLAPQSQLEGQMRTARTERNSISFSHSI